MADKFTTRTLADYFIELRGNKKSFLDDVDRLID
jgi:hypothetical protein